MRTLLFLPLILIGSLAAQEIDNNRATLIDPIVREIIAESISQPVLKIEVSPENIIHSESIVKNGQKFTIQEIAPVALPPLPIPPVAAPTSAVLWDTNSARMAEAKKHRNLMLSCTVYDNKYTLISWSSQGKTPVEEFSAWSNVNFHYFDAIHRFKKNDITYSLMYGIDDEDTAKASARAARIGKSYTPLAIPELPADSTSQPTILLIQGNPSEEEIAPLLGLLEIFQQNHVALIAEYQRLKILREKEAAERLANPPDPKPDIIIHHWNVTPEFNAPSVK